MLYGYILFGLGADSGSDLELSDITPGFRCISTPALNNRRSTVEDEHQTRSSSLTATVTHCQSAIDSSCLEQVEGVVEYEASQSAGLPLTSQGINIICDNSLRGY